MTQHRHRYVELIFFLFKYLFFILFFLACVTNHIEVMIDIQKNTHRNKIIFFKIYHQFSKNIENYFRYLEKILCLCVTTILTTKVTSLQSLVTLS